MELENEVEIVENIEKNDKNAEVVEVNPVKKRKKWYEVLKKIMKIRYKKPAFIYLDRERGFKHGSIILSNHEGTDAPMSLEIYSSHPTRAWGAHEMNGSLKELYKYQTVVYYHQKKHWNLFLARVFCLLASPLTHLFYRGLNLISTYRDGRFIKTIKESVQTIKGGESVVIYPEQSDNGYLEQLEGLHLGFTLLGEALLKNGIDACVYPSYYRKSDNVYIIDKPIKYSVLKEGRTREQVAEFILNRINELGRMQFDSAEVEKLRQRKDD